MLEKLKKSLGLANTNEEGYASVSVSKEDRDRQILMEIEKCGFWTKLFIKLKSLFLGTSKSRVYLKLLTKRLKRRIQSKQPGLTGFERLNLTPKLAHYVYDLYFLAYPLIPVFDLIFKEEQILEEAVMKIINNSLSDTKNHVYDLVPKEKLVEVFRQEPNKKSLQRRIKNRIPGYVSAIPDKVFTEIEDHLIPVFYLKHLILFPFKAFFSLGGVTIGRMQPKKYPYFTDISARIALEYLEKLYYGFYLAQNLFPVLEEELDTVFEEYILLTQKNIPDEEDLKISVSMVKERLESFLAGIENIKKHLPLHDLIRYFKDDPFYKVYLYLPKINLRDFYQTTLTFRMINELDEIYPEIQRVVVNEKIQAVFGEFDLIPFYYYVKDRDPKVQELGLPEFTHERGLNLLYNFIYHYYKQHMQTLIQTIARGVFAQNRITQNRILHYAGAIEDVEERIRLFDLTLSGEAEDGKKIRRLKNGLKEKPLNQKTYTSLIMQKDREARAHLDKGLDSIAGLIKIFTEIKDSPMDNIKSQLKTIIDIDNERGSLNKFLSTRIQKMTEVKLLLNQIIEMERNS